LLLLLLWLVEVIVAHMLLSVRVLVCVFPLVIVIGACVRALAHALGEVVNDVVFETILARRAWPRLPMK
jgi:hypothetical protein